MLARRKGIIFNWILVAFCVILTVVLLVQVVLDARSIPIADYLTDAGSETVASGYYLIPLNSASAELLQEIPGVGPVLSQSIVDYRNQHGDYQNFEELLHVKGIGDKTYRSICPYLSLN